MLKKLLNRIKLIYTGIVGIFKSNASVMIVLILFQLLLIAYLFNNIVYTVESGQAGVLYKRFGNGTITDSVFSEGLYLIYPWDRLYIYNVRVQQIGHAFSVLTKNGLKVKLSISVRYQPEYNLLGVLHKKVGPNYVNEIVIPEIESVLRLIVGQLEAEEIYTTKTGLIDKAINEAIEQISRRFVKVDDVIIKEVELPASVAGSIRYKIEQKHLAEAHIFKIMKEKREAERKRIEGHGIKAYNDIVNASLNEDIFQWMGIQATLKLSSSNNSKVIVIGSGKRGLPIIGNIVLDEDMPVKPEMPKISKPIEVLPKTPKILENNIKSTDKQATPMEKKEVSIQLESVDSQAEFIGPQIESVNSANSTHEDIQYSNQDFLHEYEQTQDVDRSEITADKSKIVEKSDKMDSEIDKSDQNESRNNSDAHR
ncbi:SPFH domain, Band 7 family protein [Candidatus Magnetomorum sp. HK-1]|nr:SPFH domain, Band 7 family protein [Candidatus Magnetomorum sp. HK-1]